VTMGKYALVNVRLSACSTRFLLDISLVVWFVLPQHGAQGGSSGSSLVLGRTEEQCNWGSGYALTNINYYSYKGQYF
jgi:hypothetical protein